MKDVLLKQFSWISPVDPQNEGRRRGQNSTMSEHFHFIFTPWKSTKILQCLKENIKFQLEYHSMTLMRIKVLSEKNHAGMILYNHFEKNQYLCSKRGLCLSMWNYYTKYNLDPFDSIPLSFPVRGSEDPMFKIFETVYHRHHDNANSVWIVKPGHCQNQGKGIRCYSKFRDIKKRVDKFGHIMIIQKYMEKPLLIEKRKFDIRAYVMCTDFEPEGFTAYFYPWLYIRTSGVDYSIDNLGDRLIHLVNDAVQMKSATYSKASNKEACKMSQQEFEEYMSKELGIDCENKIYPQIKNLMWDSIRATHHKMNENKVKGCFEIFGYDLMVDSDLKVWTIEVNTNPSWSLTTSWHAQIIPHLLKKNFLKKIFGYLARCEF